MLPLPEMDPCYLCEIVAGRADRWSVIDRDEKTLTMLNSRQFEAGQCMIVPIRHAPTILDLDDQEAQAIIVSVRRLTRVMVAEFSPDGVLLYQNNGTGSGQEVPHFHLHVVPRRPGSDWGLGPPQIARLENPDRPPALDHGVVTDAKLEVVARLLRHFR
ncbi:MAG: HIT family protein [Steroidobacteraceae bacterium]